MGERKLALAVEEMAAMDAESARDKFDALFDLTSTTKAREAHVDQLRALMREHKEARLRDTKPGPMPAAESFALQTSLAGAALAECWRKQLLEMRDRLGYQEGSELEGLLIRHITMRWLRLAQTEMMYPAAYDNNCSLAMGAYYEKRLTAAQKRFTRACETLARVRGG